ncbi:MAG TPA: asparaginase [Candidatus Limnocylindria bacterium]|nr:asparaginase [Candidatus Limnocylindria bacterium]
MARPPVRARSSASRKPPPAAIAPPRDREPATTGSRARAEAGRAPPVLVEVTRGDRIESRHRGWLTVVSAAGKAVASVGDPRAFAFIRSSAKPFQLAPFVASGRFDAYDFPAPTEALAIMAASHSGEDRHARTVQAILRAGGLTRDVLACGTHRPFDRETADRLIRDGEPPSPLRHNCSGKHAGMALHAKAAGWPVETYWEPDHPVQQLALDTVATLTDVPRDKIALATDGCGVVTFGVPLRGLALAFARLADPSGVEDPPLRAALERIRDAMMAHPELVGGERRSLDTSLMRAAPGALVSKGGAEGVQAVAILGDEPRGLAIKVEDGDAVHRARNASTVAALRQLGVLDQEAVDGRLAEFAAPPIVDPRGTPSGAVRAALALS